MTPHTLRHASAFRALQGRRDIFAVSRLLGHKTTQPTERYVDHLRLTELREQIPGLPV